MRHMRATEKEAGVSHSRQILAPTFPLLGNLQICSVHSGNGERRLHEGGVCSRIGRKAQVRAAETWAFAKSPAGQLTHSLH